MPKIRKKTSKRVTTHKREKLKHQVSEGRKKAKKQAKKNPQWKSKHKKDPGIPNNFPYKDQILAEVAEQRRQAEEAKQRRKDEKRKKASGEADEEPEEPMFGITNVGHLSKTQPANDKYGVSEIQEEPEEDEAPLLLDPDLINLKSTLETADVVLQVLDARDPLSYRSSGIDEFLRERNKIRSFLILNKIDACPRESLQTWLSYLRHDHPTFSFRSASDSLPEPATGPPVKGVVKRPTDDGLGVDALSAALKREAERKGSDPLIVVVVGIANVGKSSLVNSLCKKRLCPVYKPATSFDNPSTTQHAQPVPLTLGESKIRLIDTPALSFNFVTTADADEVLKLRARDSLFRNQGRIDRVKDPAPAVAHIVARANTEDLMLFYNLPAFAKGDENAFLSALARVHKLVKKAGELDLTNAARIILRDWASGKFLRYTLPPSSPSTLAVSNESSSSSSEDDEWKDIYAMDEATLMNVRTRKEMRKGEGIVRLVSGVVDMREVAFDASWVENDEQEDDEEEEEEEEEGESGSEEKEELVDDDMGGSDDESLELDDDEISAPPPVSKYKRKRQQKESTVPAPPAKRVTFGAAPKGSKEARAQGSSSIVKTATKAKTIKKTPGPVTSTKAKVKTLKVANSKASTVKQTEAKSPGAEEAYDFSRYF